MKKALVFLSLVVIVPLTHVAQTTPKSAPTAPKSNLGARLVTRNNNAAVPAAVGTTSLYTQIAFDWQYTPNIPACGSSLTNCYSGFTLTNTTLGTVIATPSTLGPITLSYAYLPVGGVPYGTSAFSLVANGYDGSGNPLTSPPATASVVVNVTSLNAPTNLTGKPQ